MDLEGNTLSRADILKANVYTGENHQIPQTFALTKAMFKDGNAREACDFFNSEL